MKKSIAFMLAMLTLAHHVGGFPEQTALKEL